MSHAQEEIASQPACWARAAATRADGLPGPGERVAVVGAGTSWFMAMAYAALREAGGHGPTDAHAVSEFPAGRAYDRVVAISRSGTTTEVLDLLAALAGRTATTVVTGDPAAPAAGLARSVVDLAFADERSVVQTRFATTALTLLRCHLGHPVPDASAVLDMPLPIDAATEQVTFLGRGWTVGLAHEAALKGREAAGLWTEAYPAMDYRHGPIAIAAPGRAVWAFGEVPAGLADEVAATGATFVGSSGLEPLAALVLAQRFAVAAAVHRGLDPDAPRHLSRSVVLR